MGQPGFWDNQDKAQEIVAQLKNIKAQTSPLTAFVADFEDAAVAYQLAKEESDDELLAEADELLFQLTKRMAQIELQSLLGGPHDHRDCFFTISAGDGGTEANDWAEMLLRMYLYYFEHMKWKLDEVSKTFGTEVGVDHVTLLVTGPFAFGYLKCERGTHRLARVSPFNAQGKRQTSFATVDVTPVLDDVKLEIPDADLDVSFFARSSGPGGQNVNKVASAVRMVHKPTGIMVVASTHREQPQNRRKALEILTAKLQQLEDEKRDAELKEVAGGDVTRGWGNQIRSYVIYDNRVKDHRTNHEIANPQSVLDGNIEPFIDAELKRRRAAEA